MTTNDRLPVRVDEAVPPDEYVEDPPPPLTEAERLRFDAELARLEGERFLEPIDLRALMAGEPPTEEWLVEPIILAGKATGLVSERGKGKSLLVFDISCRIATGVEILDQDRRDPLQVLYLDLEMSPGDLYDRMADLGFTLEHPDFEILAEHLHYYQLIDLPPLDTEDGGRVLEMLVERHKVAVVVIDTVSRVISGAENDAEAFRDLFRHTEARLKRRNVTLIRLDHLGKDATRGSRGSSAKEDALDVIWTLDVTDDRLTLKRTKGRQTGLLEQVVIFRDTYNGILAHVTRPTEVAGWVKHLAEACDRLNLPWDASTRTVQAALKEAGKGRRRADINQVVRFRKGLISGSGTTGNHLWEPGREPPEPTPQETQLALEETDREPPTEPPGTVKGEVSPPIRGNHPRPDLPDPWPPAGTR